ncbi:murein hydrolase activator EnvC [Malonomonas rubra]|uniref:murein hydrolase activator EnvC family protein n=1 Tax=Malonomonas rubra TaxID=57040 RepID=UPI0026E9C204|nr:peptidoglycan DD-metalloendopeptidase family protein [Malonomonas rubra]
MEKRLIALYKEGDLGPLKILFSADSPTELVQQYHYLSLIAQHDQEMLEEFNAMVAMHEQALSELEKLNRQKADLLGKEQQQRQVAADGRGLQSRLLKQVKREKQQLKNELAQLKEHAERLQQLVVRLQQEQKTSASPTVKRGAVSFGAGKGKLRWPVVGRVLIGYGTQKDQSLGTFYESNGIEIGIAPGSSIHAVADGKVVFSDWFKGYGNLLILSHPGGFHTLYAHADQLGKSIGEKVAAGEVIGKSGLGGRDSIYFEIRQDGSPINPLKWLQRR